MLVDGGKQTTVSYISQTVPIPHDKPGIAACTALAGELLGLRTIYMDTGSGAERTVSAEMIAAVRKAVDLPIIIGGVFAMPRPLVPCVPPVRICLLLAQRSKRIPSGISPCVRRLVEHRSKRSDQFGLLAVSTRAPSRHSVKPPSPAAYRQRSLHHTVSSPSWQVL